VSLKDRITEQGKKLLQDPRISQAMQDPRVVKATMRAIQLRGEVQEKIDARVDELAQSLNLATKKEVRELKRTIRKMEREMSKLQAEKKK